MDTQIVMTWAHRIFLVEGFTAAWNFCWGANDPFWLAMAKRVFLLVPLFSICLGYASTVFGLVVTPFRSKREKFLTTLLLCWWDLGRNILAYWGGVFQFALPFSVAVFGLARLLVLGVWVTIQDFLLTPFRAVSNIGNTIMSPGLPWIAVTLTLLWCVFEGVIFTYVMSPLVIDTLSNLTGDSLSEQYMKIPIFGFMLFIALGSYAVLSTWTTALKTRNVGQIVKIGAIELVAMTVEVVFLYREFVDALVPWFAQHTQGGLELGIFGTLAIAGTTWFGVRSLSWFLFAAAGTPTIMAIIQGTGIDLRKRDNVAIFKGTFGFPLMIVEQIKREMAWAQSQGERLLSAFMLPPLQVIAGGLNFCMIVLRGYPLFDLPFTSVANLSAKNIAQNIEMAKKKKAA